MRGQKSGGLPVPGTSFVYSRSLTVLGLLHREQVRHGGGIENYTRGASVGVYEDQAVVCVLVFTAILGHIIVSICLATLFSSVIAPSIATAWSGHSDGGIAWARVVT
jgi:hypothetical protein